MRIERTRDAPKRNADTDILVRVLEKALREIKAEAQEQMNAGGSTLLFADVLKTRLDGFAVTVYDLATVALEESKR